MTTKIQNSDFEKEILELKDMISDLGMQKSEAVQKTKILESQRLKIVDDAESKFKLQIMNLENDLQLKEDEMQQSLQEIELKSQENIQHIKMNYEQQKRSLEAKLHDDKDRATKRYNALVEDYEERIR